MSALLCEFGLVTGAHHVGLVLIKEQFDKCCVCGAEGYLGTVEGSVRRPDRLYAT